MHAIVHMQPLDAKRQPLGQPILAGTVPRDGHPHRIGIVVDTKKQAFPYFVHVFADGNPAKGGTFEVDCPPPERLRFLDSVTLYQWITVNPLH